MVQQDILKHESCHVDPSKEGGLLIFQHHEKTEATFSSTGRLDKQFNMFANFPSYLLLELKNSNCCLVPANYRLSSSK